MKRMTYLVHFDDNIGHAIQEWHHITAPDHYEACRLWLERVGMQRHSLPMNVLVAHATPDNLWPNGRPRCVLQLSVKQSEESKAII